MSTTLKDLTAGTIVHIDETVGGVTSSVPYIKIRDFDSGSTYMLRYYVSNQKRMNATNTTEYNTSEMDAWLENEETGFLSRFDQATRNVLQYTSVDFYSIANAEMVTIARRAVLPSYSELGFGTNPLEGTSYLNVLETVNNTTNANTARIAYTSANSAAGYWLRTANSATQYRHCSSSGPDISYNATFSYIWVRPALMVASATIVSSPEEKTIYLYPDPEKPYREIKAEIKIGDLSAKPKNIRVDVPNDKCAELKLWLCVNRKDTEPTWIEIQNQVSTDVSSITATSGYSISIKVYAKSDGGRASVGEPILLIDKEADS